MNLTYVSRWSATIFLSIISISFSLGQVLQDYTFISIDGGVKTQRTSIKILVNDVDSKSNGELEVSLDPDSDFDLIQAEIQELDGTTRKKYKSKDLETSSDLSRAAFYDDDIVKRLRMYSDQVPYMLVFEYEVKLESFVFAAAWSPCRYRNLQTLSAKLEVELPIGYPHHIISSDGIEIQRETNEENEVITIRDGCTLSGAPERFQPAMRDVIPYVLIQHHEMNYGVEASCSTWDGFGEWIRRLNRDKYELPEEEKKVVEKLTGGLSDPLEKARKLYYYLQDETTYVNVDVNFGGLESYPASYVTRNKFGDCKALTTYMKALLRHAGIESAYTLVRSGDRISGMDLDKPGQLFDHVILSVPIDGDTIWLENTSSKLPFNYLGTFTQGRKALAIYDDTTMWVQTPMMGEQDVLNQIELSYYRDGENWICQGAYVLRGDDFEHARFAENDRDELEEQLINHMAFQSVQSIDVVSDRDSSYLTLHAIGTSKPVLEDVGSFKLLHPIHFKAPKLERPDSRSSAVHIPYPIATSIRSQYTLSEVEFDRVTVADKVDINTTYGSYTLSSAKEDGKIVVDESFTLHAGDYELEEYNLFYEFFDSIRSHQREFIVVIK